MVLGYAESMKMVFGAMGEGQCEQGLAVRKNRREVQPDPQGADGG